jgi:predicted methyltransferase
MVFVFNPYKKKPKLISPKEVLAAAGIGTGEVVADYEAGAGYWTIPAAQVVGLKGRVYAIDDNEWELSALKGKATLFNLSNIQYINTPRTNYFGQMEKADLVIISNVLSDIVSPQDLLISAGQVAKVGTKLVVAEWLGKSIIPVKAEKLVTEDEAILYAAKAGFKFERLLDGGTNHFVLLFSYTGEKFHEKR